MTIHRDGRRVGEYGRFEPVKGHEGLTNYQLGYLNDGWFKGNKENGIFVKAGIRRDRMEIFDLAKKEFKIVEGPDRTMSPYRLVDTGDKVHMDISISEPYRYRDVAITDALIFAIYGGISKLEYRETGVLAETIILFRNKKRVTRVSHPFLKTFNNEFYLAKSNLSRFMTLSQAATKSCTNFSSAPSAAYTSAMALSSELEPKIRSARVPVHFTFPDFLS